MKHDEPDTNAALRAEVARLRAYLPLARAAALMAHDNPMPLSRDCGCPRCVAYWRTAALTPEQRAWLMEGE